MMRLRDDSRLFPMECGEVFFPGLVPNFPVQNEKFSPFGGKLF